MAGSTNQRSAAKSPRREAKPETGDVARLEERPPAELYELARRLEVPGYAELTKAELVEAIRRR